MASLRSHSHNDLVERCGDAPAVDCCHGTCSIKLSLQAQGSIARSNWERCIGAGGVMGMVQPTHFLRDGNGSGEEGCICI